MCTANTSKFRFGPAISNKHDVLSSKNLNAASQCQESCADKKDYKCPCASRCPRYVDRLKFARFLHFLHFLFFLLLISSVSLKNVGKVEIFDSDLMSVDGSYSILPQWAQHSVKAPVFKQGASLQYAPSKTSLLRGRRHMHNKLSKTESR